MIGNSRLHWGLFVGEVLICVWDTNYVSVDVMQQLADGQIGSGFPPEICLVSPPVPLFFASVVPAQTTLWGSYPNVSLITLEQVPMENMYPTLGIDRALAVWGAGENWGFPMLVIDAGTALTFTGADCHGSLVGGAILPGLGLQLATLAGKTGQLPSVELPQQLPQRYALNTQEAMQSGVIYTVLAGVKDFVEAWWHSQPQGNIVITGGDSQILLAHLQSQFPEIAARLIREPNLVLWGIQKLVTKGN